MRKTIKLIIISIFVLILAVLVFHNNQKKIKRYEKSVLRNEDYFANYNASGEILSLPEFSSVDIFGNTIDSSFLKGQKSFIQFINPKLKDHIDLLKEVNSNFRNRELFIIVFTEDFNKLKKELRFILPEIHVISGDYEKYKKIFHVPNCCETFYLYDELGNLIVTDFNWRGYEEGIKIHLMSLVEVKKFTISDFIRARENIINHDWFEDLWQLINKESIYKYYVVSMFTNICMSCTSARIVDNLKDLYELFGDSVYFLIIVSNDFTENDVDNLKTNLEIKFPVMKTENKLAKKWLQLKEEFRESYLTNIVFLIGREGKIINVLHPTCQDCRAGFFFKLYDTFYN